MDEPWFNKLEIWEADFPLRMRFGHARAVRTSAPTLLLRLMTRTGEQGWGQALPRAYLTGETHDSIRAAVAADIWPQLCRLPAPPDGEGDMQTALDLLAPLYCAADSARADAAYAAVETAALECMALRMACPLCPAAAPDRIPLVAVIGSMGPGKAGWLARLFRMLGYRYFKVKVGADADADARLVAAVRHAAGQGAVLMADANQAWTRDVALDRLRALRDQGVSLVEEPLEAAAAAAADFRALEREAGIPIMLDETLCTRADAQHLLERGSSSWWNLRAGKNGGVNGVRCLAALAKEQSINLYGGILVGETTLMSSAGRVAHFTAGVQRAEYGFPRVFLKGDPFAAQAGGAGGWRGVQTPPPVSVCGLGVRVSVQALQKHAVLRATLTP